MTNVVRVLVALVLVLFARTARADSSSSAAAEVLFREGRALFDDGKFEAACIRFARSQEIEPAVGTLLNLGDCYKRTGKTASAWMAYRDARELAHARGDERRVALAENEAHQLEPLLARLRIELAGTVPGFVLLLNGEPIDTSNLAAPIAVDPGELSLEASAPGRKSWYTSLTIAAGATRTIHVPKLRYIRPPSNPVATGLEIGGGVALAASVTFGILAWSRLSDVEDACPSLHCPNAQTFREQASSYKNARTFAHVSTATAVVGLVSIAAGLYLDVVASKRVALGIEGSTIALRARWP